MECFFAPMEGITGHIYRNAHHIYYNGIQKYYTPFIVPKEKRGLSAKERADVDPVNNTGQHLVPQIMTNRADDFLRIAEILHKEYGYDEVNLNLGCPSKTVVSKGRGAGFLADTCRLDAFLEEVCEGLDGVRLSIKTRVGKEDEAEFPKLLEIFKKYPLSELIVHPRVQTDYYKNEVRMETFKLAYEGAPRKWKICYNGDLISTKDIEKTANEYPKIDAIMIGRGLLRNPALCQEALAQENQGKRFGSAQEEESERKKRYSFYQKLYEDYSKELSGERNILFKLKELWMYMSQDFTAYEKYWKKMKKSQHLRDFQSAVDMLFLEQALRD